MRRGLVAGAILRAIYGPSTVDPIDEPVRAALGRLNEVSDRIIADRGRTGTLADAADDLAEGL